MPIRSYTRSTGCNRVSHGQYILSGIHIPVVVRPTTGALPFPDAQWQPLNNVTTIPTAFRTGKPLVNFHQVSTIPPGFVFQLSNHLSPPRITDGTGKFPVLHHVLHRQRLNGNRLIVTHQPGCQLVQMVFSGIGNLLLDSSNSQPRFVPVTRPLLLAAQRLLRSAKSLVVLVKVSGIGNLLPGTQRHQAVNPSIHTHRLSHGCKLQISGVIKPQTDIPLSRRIQPDGNGGWPYPFRQLPRPFDMQWGQTLCQKYVAVLPLERRFGEFCTAAIALLFEVGILRPSCKEVLESRLQMPQSLLEWNTAHLLEKLEVILFFPLRQQGRALNIVNLLLPFRPGFSPRCQCAVVDQPDTAQRPTQERFLLSRWVKAVTESLFHVSHYTKKTVRIVRLYGNFGVSNPSIATPIPPRHLEARGFSENP